MSWLFGYKKPVTDLPAQGSGGTPPPPGNDQSSISNTDSRATTGRESVYKFDSSALERAAQAAKELERSRKSPRLNSSKIQTLFLEYASQAFDVVRMQEQTKQLEIQKQIKVSISERSINHHRIYSHRNMLKLKLKYVSNINNN